jgi:asparagine synthase (glutamine-hydrolysing)
MCGIAGIYSKSKVDPSIVKHMCAEMQHRGPDGQGIVSLDEGRLVLGHRRLAIIDLSDNAKQPMKAGGTWVVYNGETYNFKELRRELNCELVSHSDTEVVAHCIDRWGVHALPKLNGMFALAAWNERDGLLLARDRYGIKPLYYTLLYDGIAFASEIKPLLRVVKAHVDIEALNQYFTFQNVLDDKTLFRGIKILQPGCYLKLGKSPVRYWGFNFHPTPMSKEEAVSETRRLFLQAVSRQLVSDVPVSAYLSGGMDTGSIVMAARRELNTLDTFTCGFDMESVTGLELAFDERESARKLSELIGTRHRETVLYSGDMEIIMPVLIKRLEDLRVGQCYPNYYVADLAGRYSRVVLSGTGGDEIFGGYPWRYKAAESKNRAEFIEKYYQSWQRLVPDAEKSRFFRDDAMDTRELFDSLVPAIGFKYAVQNFEAQTFLHGLLVVEDRVSMAHSLETRVPFLDNDLVDFAMQISFKYKVNGDIGKIVLREAMKGLLPDAVLERRKQGFSAPDGTWYRGQSIRYVQQVLTDEGANIYEYVDYKYVQERLLQHWQGKSNQRLFIWSLLCFELWLREFIQ